MEYISVVTKPEQRLHFELTRDTWHLALLGELWVSVVSISEKIDCYNSTVLCINVSYVFYPLSGPAAPGP